MIKLGEIAGFNPLFYYEGTSFYNVIQQFYDFTNKTNEFDKNQLILLIKKLSFYLEETSDIQLNSFQLIVH
jgi:hypothetical protein